jgi:hypothetical protein
LGGLALDDAGNLYGTDNEGGSHGYGDVFEFSPGPNNSWIKMVLYSFTGTTDGRFPNGALILDRNGNLYGTTQQGGGGPCGGNEGCGAVYKLTKSHKGWTMRAVGLPGNTAGSYPLAGLVFDSIGKLYGTASQGGKDNGTVFEIIP